jgi:lipoprotein signal peptidase
MLAWIVSHLIYFWIGWLAAFALTFTVFETIALTNNGLTLSMFTWHASEAWPPLIFIDGIVIGGLAVHFWWHWSPPSTGQLGGMGG